MTFDDPAGEELRSEINVTPLVDVMLVLLVIFMVVTPLLHQELRVELPISRTSHDVEESTHVHLVAAVDGTLRLNEAPVTRDALTDALRTLYGDGRERTIFLQADRSLSYAAVVDLMDACREAGVERIGVITAKAPPPASGS